MSFASKFAAVLRWATIVAGAFLIFCGVWSLVTLFTTAGQALRNPLGFLVFLYIAFFGALIIVGEFGRPRVFFKLFGFLIGRWGRSLFELFTGSLAVTAGVSNSDNVSKILMIVGGSVIAAFSFVNMCYGERHQFETEVDPTKSSSAQRSASGTTGGRRAGWFGRGKASAANQGDVEGGGEHAPPGDTSYRNQSTGQGFEHRSWLDEATTGVPKKGSGGARSTDPNSAI